MATTPEHADDNVNRKEGEGRKNFSSFATDEEKNAEKIDDLNYVSKADTLSTFRSTNGDKKSDQTSSTSDIKTGKMNEVKKVETTITKEESVSTLRSSNSSNDEDSRNDKWATSSTPAKEKQKSEESASQRAASNVKKNNAFSIENGDEEHLTDFQRQKAKYFFNVNLDIENKEYVTWEDVEFYLLFHLTAAGKEGSDGGDLEARLSRATRAFWEHVHDEVPLANDERDRLTLNQFLDTWASLVDYVVRTNQLPRMVQELVKLGFELYSTDNGDGKVTRIEPQAFDQLFQKMNLSRPYAIMAYRYLTDNGTKPLDADKVESIVKAVITSSDDEHESHFLIPGFFKTIADNKTNEKEKKSPSSVQEKKETEANGKSTPPAQSQSSNTLSSPSPSQTQHKPNEQPSSQQQTRSPPATPAQEKKAERLSSSQKQPSTPYQNRVSKPSTATPSVNEEQNLPPKSHHEVIQQEDEGIRRLLNYYRIDDGDIIEVAGGSHRRLVRVHPGRPLPSYIQQDKQLLQQLQSDSTHVPFDQQNDLTHDQKSSSETKPKVTLEERRSRGETQKGPTVPLRQEPKSEYSLSAGIRQVYPQLSTAQQEEQRRQAIRQGKPEKQTTEELSTAQDGSSAKQDDTKRSKNISRADEEKIVAAVLKQLAPIVEKRVLAELRRLQSDETDEDEDDDVIPFPFMLGGGFPLFSAAPPPGAREQQNETSQGQQRGNIPRGVDLGGLPPGVGMLPPQLLMAMMNDLAQGGMGGDGPGYPPNMPPPPRGPGGVEGFMMFVDGDQPPGGPPRF